MSKLLNVLALVIGLCIIVPAQQPPSVALLQSLRTMNAQISRQIAASSDAVKKQVDQVPTVDPGQLKQVPVAPPAQTVNVVSADQKSMLSLEIDKFVVQVTKQRDRYTSLATAGALIGAILAVVGSILSFLKYNKPAGIVSLVVAAVVSVPSIYPLAPLASFYRALSAQGSALQVDCRLRNPMTESEFESEGKQLTVLIVFEGQNRPQIGNAKDASEELSKQLQVLRTGTGVQASADHHEPGTGF
jgi:hypothetical protein